MKTRGLAVHVTGTLFSSTRPRRVFLSRPLAKIIYLGDDVASVWTSLLGSFTRYLGELVCNILNANLAHPSTILVIRVILNFATLHPIARSQVTRGAPSMTHTLAPDFLYPMLRY